MIRTKYIISFILLMSIFGCSRSGVEISAIVEEDNTRNYTIKWETYPKIDGEVRIYRSLSPTDFSKSMYIATCRIDESYFYPIPASAHRRSYFRLIFKDKDTVDIATRRLRIEGENNFRDIGGYKNDDGKSVLWGKVYRSGSMQRITALGVDRLKNLGIRNTYDLRSGQELMLTTQSPPIPVMRYSRMPLTWSTSREFETSLQSGTFKRGDGLIYMQGCYLCFYENDRSILKYMFRLLTKRENYPVHFLCTLGKDQTGFVVAILLKLLGVSDDEVMKDYLLSNDYIDYEYTNRYANRLPEESFEGFSMIVKARKEYISIIFHRIKEDFVSVEQFLIKGVGLTEKEIEQIRENLLQ